MAFMSLLSFLSLGDNPFAGIGEKSYSARAVKIIEAFLTDYTEAEIGLVPARRLMPITSILL